ncbi:MAG: alpha/beta hydrolase-fold protein [Bacteroidota bacterium]
MKIILQSLLLVFLSSAVLFPQTKESAPPNVVIRGSQLLTLSSTIVGREYELYVRLPRWYEDTTRRFPVVYVLDGQWDFSLVDALYGQQYFDGFLPGLITVGITWGGPNANYDSLRAADLTPTNAKGVPQSGNAPKFLAFIKNELVPFIESKYRVKKEGRTLMGSSYGGLFTLYAIFSEPGLFTRFIAASPAVSFDNGIIYSFEKKYFDSDPSEPVRLYMVEGGLERGVREFKSFVDQLQSRGDKVLKMQTKILENIGHSGSKAEGFTRGLQWAFERKSVTFDPSVLEKYEGMYEIRPGLRARVSVEGGRIVGQVADDPKTVFFAENENSFYLKGSFMNAHFKSDDHGKVVGVEVEQYWGTFFAKKVE